MDRNQPAVDLPEETTELLDPTRAWTPQPSAAYGEMDRAREEGARRLDALTEADRQMAERQDLSGGCVEQGHPFVIPEHEIQHTAGDVKTDLDFGVGLRSGQGQSGFGEPPEILPTRGPEGEVSIIQLPTSASQRQGT